MKALFITSAVLNLFFLIYCVLHYWRARLFHCGWKELKKNRYYFLNTPSTEPLFSVRNIFYISHRYVPSDLEIRLNLAQAIRRQRIIDLLTKLKLECNSDVITHLSTSVSVDIETSDLGFEEEMEPQNV